MMIKHLKMNGSAIGCFMYRDEIDADSNNSQEDNEVHMKICKLDMGYQKAIKADFRKRHSGLACCSD